MKWIKTKDELPPDQEGKATRDMDQVAIAAIVDGQYDMEIAIYIDGEFIRWSSNPVFDTPDYWTHITPPEYRF